MDFLKKQPSPMMLQWEECKKKSDGALLLFRLGDFYEAFHEDATILANELALTLTKRQEIPMAGIPFHTSEQYIDKLVTKGHRVAIAEQMEDPKETKGIVKRDIVRIISAGSIINSSLLAEKTNNFIACFTSHQESFGLALLDITTAECKVFHFSSFQELKDELVRVAPKELIFSFASQKLHKDAIERLKDELFIALLPREDFFFCPKESRAFLLRHLSVLSLDGFGLEGMEASITAAGSLLAYVKDTLHVKIEHIQSIRKENVGKYMSLDSTTLRHLEILQNMHEDSSRHTLLALLDHTLTPMGGRLLKFWLSHPLVTKNEILLRQEAIKELLFLTDSHSLSSSLGTIKDIERLIMRMQTGFGGPKDLLSLRLSLEEVPSIAALLAKTLSPLLQAQLTKLVDVSAITDTIQKALTDDPPLRVSDGGVIRSGFNKELDTLRAICLDSQSWIANYQAKLREDTGIKTLKVSYTKAFGYYIEVSRVQAEKMPESFERRQTLVNTERFVTPSLREYEHKVLSAEEKISAIESGLFEHLRKQVISYAPIVYQIAEGIAHLDTLFSLAKSAKKWNFVLPEIREDQIFEVQKGRHPVIEASLKGSSFIPNDVYLDNKDNRLFVITGPNMAGKSTYIRQVALLAILAQIGSFIPASFGSICLIDKVFTRIGASDNLSKGQSTFMVEMAETANILHNATDRSLVILDEIGRGTSTYDGISIAWAVAEYLLTTPGKKAKTLFATHYCELIDLEKKIPGAVNYHIAVHESAQGITFLHKIKKGGTDKSYGIHVAKLAGLPKPVLDKASAMLRSLTKEKKPLRIDSNQLFFEFPPPPSPVLEELKTLDVNNLTPMQALERLFALKEKANG